MADDERPAESFTCEVCRRSLDRWAPATRLERMANRDYLGDPIRWNEPGYCHPEHEDVATALGWRIVSRGCCATSTADDGQSADPGGASARSKAVVRLCGDTIARTLRVP